ncbi:hypothetical protein SDC9_178381 [bioreactor metagenome]|uniref:Uncharacterized protein n=1 Tax=bioreactor metagenome TaxID=1076179 RepID=A0A645GX21_9ZZZZ
MRAALAYGFLGRCNTGAVDQSSEFAQAGGLGNHGLTIGLIADIAAQIGATDLTGYGLAALCIHVGNHDLAAVGGQHARRTFAQA